ncbi:MAG TPA: glycosyltransferase family 2 protein [Acidimicrobiales bacterium]|nr:glycosyltransferase family 2 protein [Acidimicrobiales bacterium]
MTAPVVDVGVVTWNSAATVVGALRATLDSDQGAALRVLVWDNGSIDGTVAAVTASVPEAEVHTEGRNLGFAGGVNRLVRMSDAPWFLALNPDAWPEPGAVGALVRTGERLAGTAAVAPRLERPDGTLEHSTHPFPSLPLALLHAAGGQWWLPRRTRDRLFLERAWEHDRGRSVDWAVFAALLLRRTALDGVGLLDEGFFMYAEDLEWCWRARRQGWDIRFEPAARFRHVGNVSGAQAYGEDRVYVETASAYRFHRMAHGPAATLGYRLASAVASTELWALCRLRGDHAGAAHWSAQARAHLGSRPRSDGAGGLSPGPVGARLAEPG